MKKSLELAIERARQHSLLFPGLAVNVLDKKRKHAIVNTSDWVYRERILSGWHCVVTFVDGVEVKK